MCGSGPELAQCRLPAVAPGGPAAAPGQLPDAPPQRLSAAKTTVAARQLSDPPLSALDSEKDDNCPPPVVAVISYVAQACPLVICSDAAHMFSQ